MQPELGKKPEGSVHSYHIVKLRGTVDDSGKPYPTRPLCIVGPEKLRFGEALAQALPQYTFVHSIPHTTRAPRPGEVEGDDYYFVSMDAMMDGLANKMFIEAGKYKVGT